MRTSKRVIIEPKPGGWLIVGNGEITLNIHPDCNAGKAGRLRRVALEVYDTLENLPRDEDAGDGERMEEILDMVWWRIRGLDEDERQQYIKDLIDLGLVATSSNEEKEADEDS